MILDDVIKGEDIKKIVASYVYKHMDYAKYFDSKEDMHSEIMMWCVRRFPQWNPRARCINNISVLCL